MGLGGQVHDQRMCVKLGIELDDGDCYLFFFQAEDGIRDLTVTGVQTCALPISMNLTMVRQIAESAAVCDLVRARKRSPKKLWLSFDEWNVWYRARSGDATNGHRDRKSVV